MHRFITIAAVLMLTALLAACGETDDATVSPAEPTGAPEPTPAPSEAATLLPVEPDGGIADGTGPPAGMDTLTGTLGGDPQLEGGCAWLDSVDGERYEIQYPPGYEIEVAELVLRDPDGQVVARGGDEITITGTIGEDLMSICQVGTIFVAETVEPS